MAWAQARGIRHILIKPLGPMPNGYIESFNGKFRDEHLNEGGFQTLHQAREAVANRCKYYNGVRPHSSLGRMPSARFAGRATLPARCRCSSIPITPNTYRVILNPDFLF